MSRVKNWCFTAFNNLEQYEDINNIIQRDKKQTIKYIIYQGEYTKYNSEQRIYSKQPIIMVIANFKPDISKLSKDRWNIIDTEDYIEETDIITTELIAKKKH